MGEFEKKLVKPFIEDEHVSPYLVKEIISEAKQEFPKYDLANSSYLNYFAVIKWFEKWFGKG